MPTAAVPSTAPATTAHHFLTFKTRPPSFSANVPPTCDIRRTSGRGGLRRENRYMLTKGPAENSLPGEVSAGQASVKVNFAKTSAEPGHS
ncbi:hypothetical protein Pen01_67450 [Phytomonospora endophytica]|nr:hypothetical protein Pen01_67450 [Phytomonospora endophytica]